MGECGGFVGFFVWTRPGNPWQVCGCLRETGMLVPDETPQAAELWPHLVSHVSAGHR